VEIVLVLATILGGISAVFYFLDKWKQRRSVNKARNHKLRFEIERQGKTYIVPLEIREVLIDKTRKKMWCAPFKTAQGFPVAREKFSQIRSSIKGILKKDEFRGQLEQLIKEGVIVIKDTRLDLNKRNDA